MRIMLAAILSLTWLAATRLVRAEASPAVGDYVAAGLGLPSSTTATDCYASWEQYWTASRLSAQSSYNYTPSSTPVTTLTETNSEVFSAEPLTTSTYVTTIDETIPVVNGGFTISTETSKTTSTYIYTQSSEPASTSIWTFTFTSYATLAPNATVSVPPKPTCKLPSVVADCQTSWDNWVTTQLIPSPTPPPHCDIGAGFLNNVNTVPPCATTYSSMVSAYSASIGTSAQSPPVCTAASISGSLCQSVRDNYQMDENYIFQPSNDAFFFNQGTLGDFNGISTSWYWPTSSTLGSALGCTLGCGRCAVTGGTVQLIYWPEATATPPPGNGSSPASATPKATAPVTVETLGTTFTSPTLYISYRSVYAENACGTTGTVISNTILAIPTDQPLSSVHAGTIPCDAHFRPTQVWTGTAPFTVQDLPSPAYSIYRSQPWCQTYVRNHGCGNATCPTTDAYKPILVVPTPLLQSMQPAWSSCWGDIRGVYDPPIALQQVSTAKGPKVPSGPTPTISPYSGQTSNPATPASGPAPTTPRPTVSAASDNLPSSTPDDGPTLPHQSPGQSTSGTNIGGVLASILAGHSSSGGRANSLPTGQSTNDPAVATIGSQAFTVSALGETSAIVAINSGTTQTLNLAAQSVTLGGEVVSVGSSGIVGFGMGSAATTIDLSQPTSLAGVEVAAICSKTYTFSDLPNSSGVVVADASQTETLTAGGSAMTLGTQVVSIASSGRVVIGAGSQATTFGIATSTSTSTISTSSSRTSSSTSVASETTAAPASTQTGAAVRELVSAVSCFVALLSAVLVL